MGQQIEDIASLEISPFRYTIVGTKCGTITRTQKSDDFVCGEGVVFSLLPLAVCILGTVKYPLRALHFPQNP